MFHHHITANEFLYKYPLIQYKVLNRQPTILCLDQGVDEIHKYFEKRKWDIWVNDRLLTMKISRLDLKQVTLQVWNRMIDYSIRNWIALNQENTRKYNDLKAYTDKIEFLERTLIGNILTFAKGVGWDVDKRIGLKILYFHEPRTVKMKETDLVGFNVEFAANVSLPVYIGLGKAVSKGYGVIRQKRTEKDNGSEA
jgi:hypothetical protein